MDQVHRNEPNDGNTDPSTSSSGHSSLLTAIPPIQEQLILQDELSDQAPLSAEKITQLADELRADYTTDSETEHALECYNYGCPQPQCRQYYDAPNCDKYGCEFHPPDHPHGSYVSAQWTKTWSGYQTRKLLRAATASAKAAQTEVPTGLPRYGLDLGGLKFSFVG